jgi:hypothetical protein
MAQIERRMASLDLDRLERLALDAALPDGDLSWWCDQSLGKDFCLTQETIDKWAAKPGGDWARKLKPCAHAEGRCSDTTAEARARIWADYCGNVVVLQVDREEIPFEPDQIEHQWVRHDIAVLQLVGEVDPATVVALVRRIRELEVKVAELEGGRK